MLQIIQNALYFILGLICGIGLMRSRKIKSKIDTKSFPIIKEECKMVLIIRMDLKMGKGKVAAQCSHATLQAYQRAIEHTPHYLRAWEEFGTAKITLKCPDEEAMLEIQRKARKEGLVACSIQDAGRTQVLPGSRTVLAIGPAPKPMIDLITGNLSLY